MKFQVGDRVVCAVNGGGDKYDTPKTGSYGVIVNINHNFKELPYGVCFDEDLPLGHGLLSGGKEWCDRAHGWWCAESALELVKDAEIEITTFCLEDVL